MNDNKNFIANKLIVSIFCMMVMGTNTPAFAGSASAVFNFSANFVGGSCEISTPPTVLFNSGNPLTSIQIEQKATGTTETFNITLSNCSGSGLVPKIVAVGQKNTDFGQALFRDSSSEANGYGLLLETSGNGTFLANSNLADVNSGFILTNNWSSDKPLSQIDMTLPMKASLVCGDCNYSGRRGGDFIATVVFEFVYN